MLRKGSIVKVKPTGSGLRASYPAANWIPAEGAVVMLAEDAPHEGTLDVIDVSVDPYSAPESDRSVYDFNIL